MLIIGGGLAGCWAAIAAKDFAPRVTLVDKAVVSRSGCSSWAYYHLAPVPAESLADWRQELVEYGGYLNDQDWLDLVLKEHNQRLADMERWGVPFERDEQGKLNLSVRDVRGGVLAVPNFTLLADARKGRRPAFSGAAAAQLAQPLYEAFTAALQREGLQVAKGVFGAEMMIRSEAVGPVNIIVDIPPGSDDAPVTGDKDNRITRHT